MMLAPNDKLPRTWFVKLFFLLILACFTEVSKAVDLSSQQSDSLLWMHDNATGEYVSFKQTNRWLDGTPMKLEKVDGVIYLRKGQKFYRRIINERVNVRWFRAKGDGKSDDHNAFTEAISMLKRLDGGVLYVPKGDYKLSKRLLIDFDNLVIQGDGSKNSILEIHHSETGIEYQSDVPDLSTARFNIYGIGLVNKVNNMSLPEERMAGTGVYCREMHASDWRDVYIENFLDALVLDESYLNVFTSYFAQANWRGLKTVGGANGNTFYNGAQRNSSLDLRGKGSEKNLFINVDIEPASNTQFIGDNNTFQNCRFERFNLLHKDYKRPWFVLGSRNKFIKCDWFWNWDDQPQDYMMVIEGQRNEIDIPTTNTLPKLVLLKPSSSANIIRFSGEFSDFERTGSIRYSANFIQDLGQLNRIRIESTLGDTEYLGSASVSTTLRTSNLIKNDWWSNMQIHRETLSISESEIDSPLEYKSMYTRKITVEDDGLVRRANTGSDYLADGNTKFTASGWFYIPKTFRGSYVSISLVDGQYLFLHIDDTNKEKWVRVMGFGFPEEGAHVRISLDTDAPKNDFFYFSIPVLSEGVVGASPDNYP